MIETLYKTPEPEKERSECYVLVLTSRSASANKAYVFMEEHGYWDDSLGRFHHEVMSISAEEELTRQEALAMYNAAKKKLAERGFLHAFRPDCNRKRSHELRLLEQELVVA